MTSEIVQRDNFRGINLEKLRNRVRISTMEVVRGIIGVVRVCACVVSWKNMG